MGLGMIWRERQDLSQRSLGFREETRPLIAHKVGGTPRIDSCPSDQRLDVAWIECERTLKKVARFRDVAGRRSSICVEHALEIEVHRIWTWPAFSASRFSRD